MMKLLLSVLADTFEWPLNSYLYTLKNMSLKQEITRITFTKATFIEE